MKSLLIALVILTSCSSARVSRRSTLQAVTTSNEERSDTVKVIDMGYWKEYEIVKAPKQTETCKPCVIAFVLLGVIIFQ